MNTIILKPIVGIFAENKDLAREIREDKLLPLLAGGNEIIVDFSGMDGATQSFIHALISEPIRHYGVEVLDRIRFKNCNETIQKVISIVVEYLQESA